MSTLNQMIQDASARDPGAIAIRYNDASLSYGELARRANGLAQVLLQTGLERHTRVAVLLDKSLRVPVALHGVFASGGVLVPINPAAPAEQVIRILRTTGVRHLVTEPAKREIVDEVRAAYPELEHVLGLEASTPWAKILEQACPKPPAIELEQDDPAYILHTSGSTGVPKLIEHTHRSAMSFVDWVVEAHGLDSEDVISNLGSHHTCFATFDYYAAARAGATTVLVPPSAWTPTGVAQLLEQARITVMYATPTALAALSLHGELETRALDSLRWVLFAGENFALKHRRRLMGQLPHTRMSHMYGSTETNISTYYHLPVEGEARADLPIGKPCPGFAVEVVDSELQPVAEGEVGELLVSGPTLMSGYLENPAKNRHALLSRRSAEGQERVYFRTGDHVRRQEGELIFVGRTDFQVKVRGCRVELEEVEAAILSLAPVEQAAAFTVDDGEGNLSLHASAVLAPASDARQQELLDELQRILLPRAIPSVLSVVDSLPRTATGKVDRNALSAR